MTTMMRFLAAAALAALAAAAVHAQTPDGATTICKGISIPDGYTIVDEVRSRDCAKGAYLIKKSAPAAAPEVDAGSLTPEQRKEAAGLILLVDVMEHQLMKTWNSDKDYGVATDDDLNFIKGATASGRVIVDRLKKLPDGKYKLFLLMAAVAYTDVPRIRVAAGQEGGEEIQLEIVRKYKLEETTPQLWAWKVWEVARMSRNMAARDLGLPLREYEEQ